MGFLIPAIAGGASLLSGIFGNKAKANQQKEQANLYNNWLKQYMQTGQNLLGGAMGQGWNPYGPKVSTSQGTTSSTGGSSFSNMPVITGQYAPLDELMRGIMTRRLSGGSSLPQGYASSAARAINQSYAGADAAARNLAARRGLSGEQTYAVASPANAARAGALADMQAQIPLLERQLQNEDIGITQGLQSAFGRGERGNTSQWSQGQSSGTQTSPFTAGDLSGLMSILAPPSPMQGTQTGTSGFATGLDSLGALLGFLSSQQGMKQTPYQQNPGLWQGIGSQAAGQGGLGSLMGLGPAGNPF